MQKKLSICVYCGSSNGNEPEYRQQAKTLGYAIADAGYRLVYGGGTRGVMGAISSACLEKGGEVLGVIPEFLAEKEAGIEALKLLSEVRVTPNMHERKSIMFHESDAFIALPGGIGTLEELVEIMTWGQLGRHHKPIALANINQFWTPFETLIEQMNAAGFIHSAKNISLIVESDIEHILPEVIQRLDVQAAK